jgi:DNA-directed RNA polymerase II subunit RPB1
MIRARNELRQAIIKYSVNNISFNPKFMLPVNFNRVINNIKNSNMKSIGKITPKYIEERLRDMLQYKSTMLSCMTKKDSTDKKSIKYRDEKISKTVFRYALYEYLSPKVSLHKNNLNKGQFDEICNQIIDSFNKSVITPGDMIGCVAAQSIGEPEVTGYIITVY